tara:strand:+ start:274 stop:537 length:264 start_codon:yes stop_codon:yes gene_type:complete
LRHHLIEGEMAKKPFGTRSAKGTPNDTTNLGREAQGSTAVEDSLNDLSVIELDWDHFILFGHVTPRKHGEDDIFPQKRQNTSDMKTV